MEMDISPPPVGVIQPPPQFQEADGSLQGSGEISSTGTDSSTPSTSSGIGQGTSSSSSQDNSSEKIEEPLRKKAKIEVDKDKGTKGPGGDKLEQRLGGILCCAVCLDLPRAAIYQCTNGHLMCAGCFTHLLADARLRDETATCPNCRVEISKHLASRNLAVEKAVNELPAECPYCNKQFPRNNLEFHQRDGCEERTSICKYMRIGCPWRGPFHELEGHQEACPHPKKSGAEVMDILAIAAQEQDKEKKLFSSIFDLLSYEKITFNDLQLKPYRTDEFVHKLYYETSRFSAFNNQWVVKSRINNHQRDPTHSCERQLAYQLILKTKPSSALDVSFIMLKGPFGDMKVSPTIHRFEFTEQNQESPYFSLPINDSNEVNRLLSQKAVHFRLIAFLQ